MTFEWEERSGGYIRLQKNPLILLLDLDAHLLCVQQFVVGPHSNITIPRIKQIIYHHFQ